MTGGRVTTTDTIGKLLKGEREKRRMSLAEVARITRVPVSSLEAIESDHFDDLPGDVFVRGFLKSFATAVGLPAADVVARYTASRRTVVVTPISPAAPVRVTREGGRRFGVAIACVLLLILFTLAMSIVLKPRGHDMPPELSQRPSALELAIG